MRDSDTPSRLRGLTATATTLLALAAIASGASGFEGAITPRTAHQPASFVLGDSQAARAMAAMVAAARDLLLGGSHGNVATWDGDAIDVKAVSTIIVVTAPANLAVQAEPPLPERLLDLPPPRA